MLRMSNKAWLKGIVCLSTIASASPAAADVIIGPRIAYCFDNSNLRTSDDRDPDRFTLSAGYGEGSGEINLLSAVAFFSTEPGNVAEDGDQPGKGRSFAIELAKQIDRRQSLDEVFLKTAIAVNKRTEERQSPWRQGDLAFDVFVSGMRALPIP